MKMETKRTFPIVIEKDEDGFFVATNSALVGCHSQGKTIDEALQNVREATALCLADLPETEASDSSDVSVHLITA